MDPSPTLQSKSELFWYCQSSALASQIVTLRRNFAVSQDTCEVAQCEKRPQAENAPWPSSWTSCEAPTARLDSHGYQVDGRLRPRVEGAG